MNNYLKQILIFLLLVVLQTALFDNIVINMGISIYVYVMFILILPFKTPGWAMLLLGLTLGLLMDSFYNTGGIHGAATVFVAYARNTVIKIFQNAYDNEYAIRPGIKSLGFLKFARFVFILVLLHNLVVYFLELFHFKALFSNLLIALINTVLTTFIILAIESLVKKEK